MRFLGKIFTREDEKVDPKGNSIGLTLQNAIAAGLKDAAADQRQLQQAQANEAKRRKSEDQAIAAMLAKDYERV
jgi:hypothetical protein